MVMGRPWNSLRRFPRSHDHSPRRLRIVPVSANARRGVSPPGVLMRPVRSRHQRPPRPRAPSPRPRSQAITPPAPHPAAPLEPQAQRTSASGRADRARPAVSGMLGAHTAAVKRQMTRPAQQERCLAAQARRRPSRPRRPIRTAAAGLCHRAPGAASVRVWHLMSRCRRPRAGRPGLRRVVMLPCMKPAGRVKSARDPSLWICDLFRSRAAGEMGPISRGSVSLVFALVKGEGCSPAHEGMRGVGRHVRGGLATAARDDQADPSGG